jgi:metal-responsive CopG/Arc/MetJ family transcriptional regulator
MRAKQGAEHAAKPISISLSGEMESLVNERVKQEHMSRSEYFRKCIREEVERARARRLLLLNPSLIT